MIVEKRLHDLIKESHYSAATIYLKRLFPYSSYTLE